MLNERDCKRGDIFYVNQGDSYGSEQQAGRPGVIASNNLCNEYSPVVQVVYLTTKEKKKMPTHVKVNTSKYESTALCEQITAVAKERIGDYMGTCTDREMEQIGKAMAVSLAIGQYVSQGPGENTAESLKTAANEVPATGNHQAKVTKATKEYITATVERDIYKEMVSDLLDRLVSSTERK